MVRMSTGLKTFLLGSGSFIDAFDRGVIELYSGSQPPSADSPPTGTLLGKVTTDGGEFNHGDPDHGLRFILAGQSAGVTKSSDDWIATFTASGTIGWYRLKGNPADGNAPSISALRLDGAFTEPFDQLYLPNATVAAGSTQEIEQFLLTFS